MPHMQSTILDQLNRLISLFLRVPATAASARIVLCLPFCWSGLTKLRDFSGGTSEMAALAWRQRGGLTHLRSSFSSEDRYW
jgi:hypothetical protein